MKLPTLAELRERTKEEKTAIAGSVALGVVIILFLGWLVYFFHGIETTPAPDLQNVGSSLNENVLQQAGTQLQQALGSTTQFVDVEGNEEVQPISTSTDSQSSQ